MSNIDGAQRGAPLLNTGSAKPSTGGVGGLAPKVIPAHTPPGLDAKPVAAQSARTLGQVLQGAGAPSPSGVVLAYADRLKPETIHAFGGVSEVKSVNPGASASAGNPRAVYVDGAVTAERIIRHALGESVDESRVAWTHTPLGATGADFVLSTDFGPCQPVTVFWKDSSDRQRATLFHFVGLSSSQQIRARLDVVREQNGGVMRVDSVCHVRRGRKADLESAYQRELTQLASHYGGNVCFYESKDEHMALAIDVRNATIATMGVEAFEVELPYPSRWGELALIPKEFW